jgi:hypothetical protein
MQCIAYAYRPINTVNGARIPFLNPSDDEAEDPGCAFVVLPYKPPSSDSSDSSSSESSSESSSGQSQRGGPSNENRRHSKSTTLTSSSSNTDSSDYSFEDDQPVNEEEEAAFYKEVVKGQIFLGMTAMCHQPKQVSLNSSYINMMRLEITISFIIECC